MAANPPVSDEEFIAWRDDPVTGGVLEAFGLMAEAQKQAWLAASWEGGAVDPILLAELRTRAEAYSAIAECSYHDFFGVEE